MPPSDADQPAKVFARVASTPGLSCATHRLGIFHVASTQARQLHRPVLQHQVCLHKFLTIVPSPTNQGAQSWLSQHSARQCLLEVAPLSTQAATMHASTCHSPPTRPTPTKKLRWTPNVQHPASLLVYDCMPLTYMKATQHTQRLALTCLGTNKATLLQHGCTHRSRCFTTP